MLELENEWPIGPDGLPTRTAARLILVTDRWNTLLLRGHDFNDAGASWWFTVGGGLAPGESPKLGAIRECREETGLQLEENDLTGPVIYRDAKFRFADRTRRQMEYFYLATVPAFEINKRGWTRDERRVLDDIRWFTLAQLHETAAGDTVYPRVLPHLLTEWANNGWDGHCVKISEM